MKGNQSRMRGREYGEGGCRGMSQGIYLAGKIGKNDWRTELVGGLREAGTEMAGGLPASQTEPPRCWDVLEGAIDLRGRSFDYTGPFFIGCDHGCWHRGVPHARGCGVCGDVSRDRNILALCTKAIDRSDCVFTWIDAADCHGTVAEIGYAHAKGKRVGIAGPAADRDMWFVHGMAEYVKFGEGLTPREALEEWLVGRAGPRRPREKGPAVSGPYHTVVDWCRRIGRGIDDREAARHGTRLTRLCKGLGVEVRRVPDSRWGRVNAYPASLLQDLLGGGPVRSAKPADRRPVPSGHGLPGRETGGGLRVGLFDGLREVRRLLRR